jgi:uncharacterized membrane protein YgcG
MTRAHKLLGAAAAVLMMVATSTAPAKAQFASGGDQDMMTQMAPMLDIMKAKMGKKRFASLIQTMGPMMQNMTDGSGGGGFGGMNFGGGFGGGGFGSGGLPFVGGGSTGGFDTSTMMSMMPQLMSLMSMGGTGRHAHHKS